MRKSKHSRLLLEPLEDRALLSHMVHDLHHLHHVRHVQASTTHSAAVSTAHSVSATTAGVTSASKITPTKGAAAGPTNPLSAGATQPTNVVKAPLQGTASGAYALTPTVSSGATYTLSGSGHVSALGNVQITGAIQSEFSQGIMQLSGTLTLTDSQGSIQLSVQWSGRQPLAPSGSGGALTSSPPANLLAYTILSGTGAFKSMRGTGTVSLALLPPTVTIGPPRASGGGEVTPAPLAMPTFLHGNFVLSFNAGAVAGPSLI